MVLWREFGLVNSFTIESTYCGFDFGEKKGMQISIPDMERMGADFCRALDAMLTTHPCFTGKEETVSALECSSGDIKTSDLKIAKSGTPPSTSSSVSNTPARPRKKTSKTRKSTVQSRTNSGLTSSNATRNSGGLKHKSKSGSKASKRAVAKSYDTDIPADADLIGDQIGDNASNDSSSSDDDG